MVNDSSPNQQHGLGMPLLAATLIDHTAAVHNVLDSQLPILDRYGCAVAINASEMGYVKLAKLLYERHPAKFADAWFKDYSRP